MGQTVSHDSRGAKPGSGSSGRTPRVKTGWRKTTLWWTECPTGESTIRRMPPVQGLPTGCEKQWVNTGKETAVDLLNAYIATHTLNTSHIQGSALNKSEKLTRPKITQDTLMESRSPSQAMGTLYKTGTGEPKEEYGLPEQLAKADTNIASKPEAEHMGLLRRQAVVPMAMSAKCSKTPGTVTEQKEVARDAVKEEITAKSGHREQQAPVSPANEAELPTQTKRESCTVPVSQRVRGSSGQLRKHKLCRKRWKTPPQKRDTSNPRAMTNKDETVKTEEAPTTCIPDNWSTPRRSTGTVKGRNKPRQLSRDAWNNNVKASTSGNDEVAITRLKDGAAIVLDHHTFDPESGWVKEIAWKQPALQLSIRPCQSIYAKLGLHTLRATPTKVDGIADTGAQVCLWSAADFYKAGYKRRDLVKVRQQAAAINRQPIRILGAVFLAVEAESIGTNLMALVTPEIRGLYLSRQVLTALCVIPRSFPTAGDARNGVDKRETVPTAAPIASKWAPCDCILRQAPPSRPNELPLPAKVRNIPRMRRRLLAMFAGSTFNKCPHQPSLVTKDHPLTLRIERDAKPTTHHTPYIIPTRWKNKVRSDLNSDERLGIIEKVPEEIPTTWQHRLEVVANPNGEPWGVVDLSPLNRPGGREKHVSVPPFVQAWQVPAQAWKTVTKTWSHSAPIREKDKHFTTFITEWGRYRYRVIPHGLVPGNSGHVRRHDRITKPIERRTRVADETIMWDADHDLEAHWWRTFDYLALMGRHGITLDGDEFQFCGKTVDYAGFRMSEQEVTPMQHLLEPIAAFPTPRSVSDARSWFDLVSQITHHARTQRKVAPFKALSPSTTHLAWTKQLAESFTESKQEILGAIKCGMEAFDPARPTKLHAEYAEEGLGFYLAQKHCGCTKLDPSCCDAGWRTTLAGSRTLRGTEAGCTRVEGDCLSVAWALEQTKYFTLDCPKLVVVANHEPSYDTLRDRAWKDIASGNLSQLKEKMLPWNFATMYRPSKANSVAGCMARHPVATPKQDGSSSHACNDGVSRSPVLPRNRMHPLIDPIKCAPENDEVTQKVISYLADETLRKGPELGTEVEELWRYRDRLPQLDDVPLRDGAAVIPTKLRQAVVDILGATYRDARAVMDRAAETAFGPDTDEDISEHAKSWQAETQPHPCKRMVVPRMKAPTRRQREYERERTNEATREPHRVMGRAGGRPKRTKKMLHEASRGGDPTNTAPSKAQRSRKFATQTRTGESTLHTARNARARLRRNKKPSRADTPATQNRQLEILPRSGLSLGGEGISPGRLTPMARTLAPRRKAGELEKINPPRYPGQATGGKATRCKDFFAVSESYEIKVPHCTYLLKQGGLHGDSHRTTSSFV